MKNLLKLFEDMKLALLTGLALTLLIVWGRHGDMMQTSPEQFWIVAITVVHVLAGILWIGLLWYFNFVQIPTMPKVPAELKPGITKHIAPVALFWFRWAAAATVAFGLLTAMKKGYMVEALSLHGDYLTIGLGMWLALIMAFNVWFIIWPNQQRALGLVPADDATKAASARMAMLFSRFNFIMSWPMLYCMISQGLLG